jgi:hypothetical protein
VLSPSKRRYVEICTYKINNPDTSNEKVGAHFDVERRTVDRAIAWGRKQGLFQPDGEKLRQHIAEWREHERWLEQELRLQKRDARKDDGRRAPMQSFALTSLSRELREVRTKIAELEGLYKQTVNVNIGGQEGNELKLTIQRGGDGES